MTLLQICSLFSSFSFFGYVIAYFMSPHMKLEFKRFSLEKTGFYIIMLELLGAIGLLVGLKVNPILSISSLGLFLLMISGVMLRIRLKDSIKVSLPAIFYMILNGFIFFKSIFVE